MDDFENAISQFLHNLLMVVPQPKERLTCSADVLIKTGCPLRIFLKMGINFFRNGEYIGPVM
jgi:hypothetical protein